MGSVMLALVMAVSVVSIRGEEASPPALWLPFVRSLVPLFSPLPATCPCPLLPGARLLLASSGDPKLEERGCDRVGSATSSAASPPSRARRRSGRPRPPSSPSPTSSGATTVPP